MCPTDHDIWTCRLRIWMYHRGRVTRKNRIFCRFCRLIEMIRGASYIKVSTPYEGVKVIDLSSWVSVVVYEVCLRKTNFNDLDLCCFASVSTLFVLFGTVSWLSNGFPHWKLELAHRWGRDNGGAQNDTSTWYLTAHHRLISCRRPWGYQVSSYPIANVQILGIAMSQIPIFEVLVSPSPPRNELRAQKRFTFWRIHGSPAMWGPWLTYYPLPLATTIWMSSTY